MYRQTNESRSTASPSNRTKALIATDPLGHGNCQNRTVWSKRCPSASLGEAGHGTPRYQDWTYYNILNLLNFTLSYHVLSRNLKISSEEFWRCLPCSISPFEFGCCDTIPLGTPYDILRWAMELVDWSVNGLAMTSSPMNYTQHIIFHPLISNTFHMAPQNRIISHLLASYLPSMAHPGKAGGWRQQQIFRFHIAVDQLGSTEQTQGQQQLPCEVAHGGQQW
jgi:hypothetical protein